MQRITSYFCSWQVGLALFVALMIGVGWLGIRDERRRQADSYLDGRESGLLGQPPESCPYSAGWGSNPRERESWMRGWSAGDAERRKTK